LVAGAIGSPPAADEWRTVLPTAKRIAAPILTAAVLPFCLGAAAFAQEIKLTRSADSGIESLLVDERSWDAKCKPLTTSITITSPPTNGKVTIVPGVSTVAAKSLQPASVRRCAGKSVPGNQIRYRSNPGFHGTDSLGYTVRYGNGQRGSTAVTIDVH
jgi:hypothetical protein